MAAEFQVKFGTPVFYLEQMGNIKNTVSMLDTFSGNPSESEFRLRGMETRGKEDCEFDVRFFFDSDRIFLKICSHPASIEHDLKRLFEWLRRQSKVSIEDEDGEQCFWDQEHRDPGQSCTVVLRRDDRGFCNLFSGHRLGRRAVERGGFREVARRWIWLREKFNCRQNPGTELHRASAPERVPLSPPRSTPRKRAGISGHPGSGASRLAPTL